MVSRVMRSGSAGPTPAQCDRIRLRWSWVVSAAGILTWASLPKPVLTP